MNRPERSEQGPSKLRLRLSLFLACLIGALFLYLAAQTIPLAQVSEYLHGADWWRVAAGVAVFSLLYLVCHGARVLRWVYLVRPLGEVDRGEVYRIGAVGFAAILVVPFRLGELVRPFLLARNTNLPAAGGLATVVVERVIDGLVVTGLLFLGLWTYEGGASVEWVRGAGVVAACIFVPALAICVVAQRQAELARRIVMATAGRVSRRLGEKLALLLMQFVEGFNAMGRRRDLVPFLGFTLLYWLCNALSMWALMRIGFGLDLGLWQTTTVLAVLVVGIMVPAGPAMVGNFEFFLAQGMGLFVPLEQASVAGVVGAYAALLHVAQVAIIVLPGVWLMIRHRSLRLSRQTLEESQKMERYVDPGEGGKPVN